MNSMKRMTGWIVQLEGGGVILESLDRTEVVAVAKFVEHQARIGQGKRLWREWVAFGYVTRRAVLTVEEHGETAASVAG